MIKLGRYRPTVIVTWIFSFAILFWLSKELGFASDGHQAPAPVVEPEGKVEDGLRLRVRKRLEEGPTRETASVDTAPSTEDKEVKTLFEKLQAQQQELEAKTQALVRREQQLAEREALVKTQLTRYEETLTSLRAEVDSLRGLKNAKLDEFRKVYSKMEPKKAARILDDIDTDLAGQIISSLKESQSAEILGQMDPEKARRITARFLTGRSFSQTTSH